MQTLIGIDVRDVNYTKKINWMKQFDCIGIFSTLHLPEFKLIDQLNFLKKISKLAKQKKINGWCINTNNWPNK